MRRGECLASRHAPFPADNFLALPGRHASCLERADRLRRPEIVDEGLGGGRVLAVGGDSPDEHQLVLKFVGEGTGQARRLEDSGRTTDKGVNLVLLSSALHNDTGALVLRVRLLLLLYRLINPFDYWRKPFAF